MGSPLLAKIYDTVLTPTEWMGVRDQRRRLMEGLSGRVVEIGAGTGANFVHYPPEVTEVGCWAHARRKFYQALESAPDEAGTVMAGIQRLYAVEVEARDRDLDSAAVARLARYYSLPSFAAGG